MEMMTPGVTLGFAFGGLPPPEGPGEVAGLAVALEAFDGFSVAAAAEVPAAAAAVPAAAAEVLAAEAMVFMGSSHPLLASLV